MDKVMKTKILYLDIETQNDWQAGESSKIEDQRVSFTGVIDQDGNAYEYWEDDMDKLYKALREADLIVHYNGFTFDMPILANYMPEDVMHLPQIDLMVALKEAIGFRPKLDNVAKATLGYGKIGKGSDAIVYWKNQDLESLKKYCLMDVQVTKEVHEYGLEHGKVNYFDKDGFLIETPIDWEQGRNKPPQPTNTNFTLF